MDDFYNGNILYSFSTVHRVMITGLIVYAVPRMKIDDRLKNIFLWSALFNMAILSIVWADRNRGYSPLLELSVCRMYDLGRFTQFALT